MSRINKTLASFFVLLLAAGGLFFYLQIGSSSDSEISELTAVEPFPQRTNQTVLIPRHDGQVIGYFDYDKVGHLRIKRSGKIFYDEKNDNVVEITAYRADGTMERSEKVFPASDLTKELKRRRLALFDLDGITFLRHEVYNRVGQAVRLGMRQPDRQYRIRYYYSDGKTVHRDRYFTPYPGSKHQYIGLPAGTKIEDPSLLSQKYILEKERVLRTDGSVQSEIYRIGESFYKRFYNAGGKRIAIFSRNIGGELNGEIYSNDAKTLLVSFTKNDSSMMAYFRRENGSYSQSRKSYGKKIVDTFYGVTTNLPQYEQTWIVSGTDKENGEREYTLSQITEFGGDQSVSRTITFKNGKPYSVSYPLPNSTFLFKYIDEQGYVLRTETKRGREVIAFTMPDEKTQQEKFFASWLVRSNPVEVDSVRFEESSSPPWIYDYDDSKFKNLN